MGCNVARYNIKTGYIEVDEHEKASLYSKPKDEIETLMNWIIWGDTKQFYQAIKEDDEF